MRKPPRSTWRDSEHTFARDLDAKIEAMAEGIGMGTP